MFENLYTTKMSANKKTLQNRFTKIRSKSGRLSKMMALVMSVVIAATFACATVVMAAVGSDGLEYWDKNEIYFLRSMSFETNILGKNVPDWVHEDVAGNDGNITVTLTHYQMRHAVTGNVALHTIIDLTGTNGTTKLYSVTGGNINSAALWDSDGNLIQGGAVSSFDYPYTSSYRFVEATKQSGLSDYAEPFIEKGILDLDTGKRKCVHVEFGIDEEMNIQGIRLNLCLADENNSLDQSNDTFDSIDAPLGSLNIIGGDAEKFLNTSWLMYFTEFEDNYKNIENNDVNINVEKAGTSEIIINTNVALERAKYIDIVVLNKNGDVISRSREDFSDKYILIPDMNFNIEKSNTFNVGEKYRICIGVLDDSRNLIYRWQEYVTIK